MKRTVIILAACLCLLPSLSAQETRKYEIGVSASYGTSLDKTRSKNYGFDLYGGYKLNHHFSVGAGLNYVNFMGGRALPSGIEYVYVSVKSSYHAFRPYVYGRYDFLPMKKWTPFVGLRAGYAFFKNTTFQYYVLPADYGSLYDPVDLSEYEYLKDLDHTLVIKGRVFGTLDLGASCHFGKKGSKLSMGAFLDVQPVKFEYYKNREKRINTTAGLKIGFSF